MAEATLNDISAQLKEQNKGTKGQTAVLQQIAKSVAGPSASQQAEKDQEKKVDKAAGGGGGRGFGGGALKGIMGIFKKIGKFVLMLKTGLLFLLLPAVLMFINSEFFQKALTVIKDVLMPALKATWEWLQLLFKDPMAALKKLWEGIVDGAADIGDWIWNSAIKPAWTWLEGIFVNTDWGAFFGNLLGKITNVGQWIYDKAIAPFWSWISSIAEKEGGWGPYLWGLVKAYMGVYKSIGEWIWNKAIQPFWTWISGIFKDIDWGQKWKDLWGAVTSIGGWIWDNAIVPFWDWIGKKFTDFGTAVGAKWKEHFPNGFWSWTYDKTIGALWTWIKDKWGDFTTKFSAMWVANFPNGFWTWMYDKTLGTLWTWIGTKWNNFTTKFSAMWDANFPNGFWTWMYDSTLGALWTWIGTKWNNFTEKFSAMWEANIGPDGFWSWMYKSTLGALWTWIGTKWNNFKEKFTDIWDANFPKGFWTWVYDKTLGKLVTGITDVWGNFQETYIKPWTDAFKEHGGFWGWVYAKTLGSLFTWLGTKFTNMGKAMGDKYTEMFGEGGITGWIWDHTIGGLFDWMKQVLDIDWGAMVSSIAPDWVKEIPLVGKLFKGGGDDELPNTGPPGQGDARTMATSTSVGPKAFRAGGAVAVREAKIREGLDEPSRKEEMGGLAYNIGVIERKLAKTGGLPAFRSPQQREQAENQLLLMQDRLTELQQAQMKFDETTRKAAAALLLNYNSGPPGQPTTNVSINAPTNSNTTAVSNTTENLMGASDPYVGVAGAYG